MKKLYFENNAKNRINLLSLYERSIAAINSFSIPNNFDYGDDILELWELLYELEYKYNMIRFNPFDGLEKRRENIIKIIENKAEQLIPYIAETLEYTFSEWLENHALTDSKKWARQRLSYEGMSVYEFIEMEGVEGILDSIIAEMERYVPSVRNTYQFFMYVASNVLEVLNPLFEIYIEDYKKRLKMDLEDIGVEEFNERYSHVFNKEFENMEEAENFIDRNIIWGKKSYWDMIGGKEAAIKDAIFEMDDLGYFNNLEEILSNANIEIEDFLLDLYEKALFPIWYKYWKSQGIDATRKNVEKVYKSLLKIKSLPLQKQFMTINIAKNTNHQNGSMMEYYTDRYNVYINDFERLSKMDVSEWNKDLREIGVMV